MIIQIELIVVAALILLLLIWSLWLNLTTFINKRRYKKENDKARRGEIERGELGTSETGDSSSRPTQPTERELLSSANTSSPGKDSKRNRNSFKRRRFGRR